VPPFAVGNPQHRPESPAIFGVEVKRSEVIQDFEMAACGAVGWIGGAIFSEFLTRGESIFLGVIVGLVAFAAGVLWRTFKSKIKGEIE